MRLLPIALIGIFLPLLSAGCASGRSETSYSRSLAISPEAARQLGIPEDGKDVSVDVVLASLAGLAPDKGRGALLALISRSDQACEEYMAKSLTTSNTILSMFGVAGLALSSAAALSTPIDSANLLAGLSTFAAGTEKELSDTVLGGQTPALLYRAVMSLRARERAELATLMLADLQLAAVASRMTDYHGKCGVTVGRLALEDVVVKAEAGAAAAGVSDAQATMAATVQLLNRVNPALLQVPDSRE